LLLAMVRDAERLAAQGGRLKELRLGMRVSQETAAHNIGVSVRAYRDWEGGKGGINAEHLKAVAEYFSTTEDWIEYGEFIRERPILQPFPTTNVLARIEKKISQLEEQVSLLRAELAARDAEVLAQIEQALRSTQAQ
jgi:transcriptional regulator with XRE-family HTH domain